MDIAEYFSCIADIFPSTLVTLWDILKLVSRVPSR